MLILKYTDFNTFYLGRDVVVLKELIFKGFYIWKACCGLQRTDLLISFYFRRELWS